MTSLQFGPNLWPHQWQDVSHLEELGYDSVWTSEHFILVPIVAAPADFMPHVEAYAREVIPNCRA